MATTSGDSGPMREERSGGIRGSTETWTVLRLIEWSSRYLAERGFEECRLHVEYLLGHVLGLSRLDLYLQFDRPLKPHELESFKEFFRRRLTHEPLQYILGEATFMGFTLEVDRTVLIPRPETEILVELAVAFARELRRPRLAILDIGTGSGNIAVAMGHFLPESLILSVDKDPEALSLARRNIGRHALRNVTAEKVDILVADPPGNTYDLIISNPPYIAARDFADLQPEVRLFEPRAALTDEDDGLTFMRRLILLARTRLSGGGRLFLEIGFGQAGAVGKLLAAAGFDEITISDDYSHIPRVVQAQAPEPGKGTS